VTSKKTTTFENHVLLHFTHEGNLSSIIEEGVLMSDTMAQAEACITTEVGNRDVKERRRSMEVPVGPGGCPADYVPWYFAPRSPMLFAISKGNVPEYQDGQNPLVYLVTDVRSVIEAGRPWVFSDGNCASAITEYSDDLADLVEGTDSLVDWAIMKERYWADTMEDPDRMRRRMAEFLVHEYLPWSAVKRIVVRTQAVSVQVQDVLDNVGDRTPVRVKADWYY
jgi:hypothetical protein